jgi:hypothetical protein
MRRAVLLVAGRILLACPVVLAFFAGGYFDQPRLVAGVVAWALVIVVLIAGLPPLPVSWPGRAAVAGLATMCAWTGVSLAWAPLAGPALDSTVRLLLYLGTLVAAVALLRQRSAMRAVEPVLGLGAAVVLGYGLCGRLLPTVVEHTTSWTAGARLEQPITYWNAEGLLGAMGLVLCARMAGDRSRPLALRALAAASAAPLGMGIYLSYSRGAMAAALVGICVLVAAKPTWPQLRAAGLAVVIAIVTASASAAFPGVSAMEGTLGQRVDEGLAMLTFLLCAMALAAIVTVRVARDERSGRCRMGLLRWAHRLPALAAVAVILVAAGIVGGGIRERGGATELNERPNASRLTSVASRRYDYWRIGVRALDDDPLRGAGAGAFRVIWLRERPVPESALEVHSLELEVALELGVIGALGLVLLVVGTGVAARRAMRQAPQAAAGAVAACTVWIVHATIDWDWQVPAVTLPAIVLAGGLIALAEGVRPAARVRAGAADSAPVSAPPAPGPIDRPDARVGSAA